MAAADDTLPARPMPTGSILAAEYRRLTLGVVAVVFLVAFEAMAVSTALPVAVRSLNGLRLYGIAFSAFLTTSLFAMVLAGERSDARGPVLPLLGGIGGFGVGLLLAGAATAMPVFVLGRAVQGFGAGLIIVALYVVVARAYPEDTRPRVFSAMSAAWVLPSILGPVAAGFVAEHLSWRWVFLGILALIVPAVAVMAPGLRRLGGPTEGAVHRPGRLLLALGTAFGIAVLQYAGQNATILGGVLAVGALLLVVPTVSRLLPAGTLRAARGLPTVILMRGLLAGAFFGAEAFIPLMFVTQRGLSPTVAGMTLTGSGLSWSVGSWYQSRPRLRVTRSTLVQVGAALVAAGTAAASLGLWSVLPPAVAAAGWCLAGLGMGLGLTSLSVLLFELSPPGEAGVNSAAMQIADVLLATVTIAAGGSLFAALHTRPGWDAAVFVLIFLIMCGIGLIGTAVAPRVRRSVGAAR